LFDSWYCAYHASKGKNDTKSADPLSGKRNATNNKGSSKAVDNQTGKKNTTSTADNNKGNSTAATNNKNNGATGDPKSSNCEHFICVTRTFGSPPSRLGS
jgi:hypothetical protein